MSKEGTVARGLKIVVLLPATVSGPTPPAGAGTDIRARKDGRTEPEDAATDTSGRWFSPPHDWFDPSGRRIMSRDAQGGVRLYWYGERELIVRVAGLSRRARPGNSRPHESNEEAWSHLFEYAGDGTLAAEIDCKGERHEFKAPGAKIDSMAGTALLGHRHIRPTGFRGFPNRERPGR
ncbi:MAG: hypothetical protein HYY17_13735 [Planctomycetes bacterium]|nr:hypothetical protein [Planctomycetota bacterium]